MDNLAESPHEQLQRARCQAAEYRISQRPGVYDDERSSSNSGQTADEEDVDEDDSTCGAATDAKTELTPPFWSKHLSVILAGTRDSGSPWHLFNGYEDVLVKDIYTRMVATWQRAVVTTFPASVVGRVDSFEREQPSSIVDDLDGAADSLAPPNLSQRRETRRDMQQDYAQSVQSRRVVMVPVQNVVWTWQNQYIERQKLGPTVSDKPLIAFSTCGVVNFPPPQDIHVNMMPFVMGDVESLPLYLQHYFPMIMSCPTQDTELGKVCYLTIDEGTVKAGTTQRRPGLHIEAPNRFHNEPSAASCSSTTTTFAAAYEHHWGCGVAFGPDELHGGIFMASTVADSSAIYNALVVDRNEVNHHGGNMEHLRPFLGRRHVLRANELVWFTDTTPHEALALDESSMSSPSTATYRQYFRLVTSDVNVWYQQHSTRNPLVPLPDYVQVIAHSKFDVNDTGEPEIKDVASATWSSSIGTLVNQIVAASWDLWLVVVVAIVAALMGAVCFK